MNPAQIQTDFSALLDDKDPNFVGYPNNQAEQAKNWGKVIGGIGRTIAPPSVSVDVAQKDFEATILSIGEPATALPIIISAFTKFATTLALGMQPNFTGTPPPAPIDFTPVTSIPLVDGTAQARVSAITSLTYAWFSTGLAVNNASGVTLPWK